MQRHHTLQPTRRTPSRHAATKRRSGFTLIEIMAVVVIMGLLMTVLAVGVNGQIVKARISAAQTQIARIEQALDFYQLDAARYPTVDQGLEALVVKPSSPPVPKFYTPGGYIKPEALLDPWGEPFEYRIPGTHNPHAFDLWSKGPDGQEGDDDITNWTQDSGSA